MLHYLRVCGYIMFIVSAHPTPGKSALNELKSKIVNLGIEDYVEKFYCSDGGDKNGKTHILQDIMDDYDIKPNNAYMVGDSYYYDYEAGKNAGLNSIFIKNDYCKQPSPLPKDVRLVESITELVV